MIREEHWERYYIPIYRIRYHFPQDWLITERLKKRLIKVSAREITLNFYPSSNPQISASNIFLKDDYIAKIKQDFPPSIFTKLLLNTPLKNPHGEKSTSRTIIKEKKWKQRITTISFFCHSRKMSCKNTFIRWTF